MPKVTDDKLLVGVENVDDAAVYELREDLALIQTLDFFTPIVDDPFTFGQIAAANSLSDIYAMGGEPLLAMNIVCFPNCLSPDVLAEILKGGADKCMEAGTLVVGGHTVQDDEPKFGLSVSAVLHPKNVLTNSGSKPGDVLVLTKPIGVGIINTALKGGMLDENGEVYKNAVKSMATLNKVGQQALKGLQVNACTDITGFGLIGHALEMAEGSKTTIKLYPERIPMLDGAMEFANMGLVPAGSYDNRKFVGDKALLSEDALEYEDILFDPQTSGGLLISLPKDQADILMDRLVDNPVSYGIVGEVVELGDKYIIIE